MNIKKFIEKYCLIKDKNSNTTYSINLTDYQNRLIDYFENKNINNNE